jgi:peptide/nickel transport system substrate-binding protein
MKEFEYKLDVATKLARKGRVSRRDFVQLAIAAGLTATAANAMFTTAARAEPKKGGHFRMGMGHGATTDSLDPATYPDQMTGTVGWGSMGNSLTEVDAKGRIIPDLAESFEPGDDAKTWVFKLRKGATFHNGKNVTADDVIASFRHHMGKDSNQRPSPMSMPSPTSRPTATTSSSACPAAMPISPISPATITFRSCRRRATAPSTGSRASAPGPTFSTNGSRAFAQP